MNILLTALQPGGGIRTYFRYIYGDLCFSDCHFTLVAPDHGLSQFLSRVLPDGRLTVEPAAQSKVAYMRQIRRAVTVGRYDVVQAHGFSAGLLSAAASLELKVPFMITTHDVFLDGRFSGIKGWVQKQAIGFLLGRANLINPVGHDAAANLAANYPRLDTLNRISPIRNGIHVESFITDERRQLKRELGLGEDKVLLGFFGRFMRQKGFSTLRDALALCLEENGLQERLVVVCFGWGGFIREEQEELERQGLTPWFRFVDHTDNMAEALRGVDVAVMPSRWEACPLLPMEAMVSGVPIIASDCIGMKEVTEDTPAQRFPVDDVQALARCIRESVVHLEHRKLAAEAFRQKAVDRFDARGTARSLRELFDSLAKPAQIASRGKCL